MTGPSGTSFAPSTSKNSRAPLASTLTSTVYTEQQEAAWPLELGVSLRLGGARDGWQVVLGPVHAGAAVEDGAARDDQRWGLDVAVQPAGRVDHDLARGDDVADDRAADLDRARTDRPADRSGLGDADRLGALELAAEL